MDWYKRFQTVIDDLAATPGATITTRVLNRPEWEIDEEYREDIELDGGFVVDAEMSAFFSQIGEVHVEWEFEDHVASVGYPVLFGVLNIANLDEIIFSGYTESSMKNMGPRDDAERDYLLALRHLNPKTCAGDHWLALVPDEQKKPHFWWRTQTAAGLDVPLSATFEELMDSMLKSRGAFGWPLLHADLTKLTDRNRRDLLHEGYSEAAAFRQRLSFLETFDPEDAGELSSRLDGIVAESAKRLT